MKARALLLAVPALTLAALALTHTLACGPSGFDPAQKLDTVRILATRADADESYAHPGDTVTLETLAIDARTTKTAPMKLYWVPVACANPEGDAYYACFAGAGDAGLPPDFSIPGTVNSPAVSDDAGVALEAGADGGTAPTSLTAGLPTFTFTVPTNLPLKQPAGAPAPYGLVIVFNVACAGQLKLLGLTPGGGPQQVPVGCVDDAGNALGPEDYVVGYTRVYVYDKITNANPEVDGIVVNGAETRTGVVGTAIPDPVDISLPVCGATCQSVDLDVDVPTSSWEVDPNATASGGGNLHESLWVDYFAMGGSIDSEARLLYDSQAGHITGKGSTVSYTPPPTPGDATIWAVVHDNRDGITWLQVNVHAY
jgi:hypothetical protein